jgi:hypothetical protein
MSDQGAQDSLGSACSKDSPEEVSTPVSAAKKCPVDLYTNLTLRLRVSATLRFFFEGSAVKAESLE